MFKNNFSFNYFSETQYGSSEGEMGKIVWYVVDNFGNIIAGPFLNKRSADSLARNSNNRNVVPIKK